MKEIKKVTKVYTLRRFGGASFEVNWCGQKLKIDFVPGRGAVGSKRSVLTVSDKFTQDAIEHDPRFGSLITVDAVYGDDNENENKEQNDNGGAVAAVHKVRYTRKQLEAMKAAKESEEAKVGADASANALETETAKEARMECAEDATAKEEKKKGKKKKADKASADALGTVANEASGKALETGADKASGEALETETAEGADKDATAEGDGIEIVESVRTLNDAYDYFADKGIVAENEGDLADAMQKAKVVFPNMK